MPKDILQAVDRTKVLFENSRIRVIELNWQNGLKTEMHTHPDYFTYALTDATYKSTGPDGKSQKRTLKKGQLRWFDAETHIVESKGRSGRALVIELK